LTIRSEKSPDGKSYINPPSTKKSPAYSAFPDPITNGPRGGFDLHIYFQHTNPDQVTYAKSLWQRIRHEFPELRIYTVFERPVGPHPIGMFEVNLFTPEQFGAFVPWLNIHRGPLSVLVHPNTGDALRDHTQRAVWMGERYPLDLGLFKKIGEMRAKEKAEKEAREGEVNGKKE
jgi:DOPA 4,5-dioxygenase